MILLTTKVIKILLAAVMLAVGYGIFRNKADKKVSLGLTVMIALSALSANAMTCYVPRLTDEVTLKATGEKNPASQAPEIVIEGFLIDGKECPVNKVPKGKWFWRGDQYMWRPETDTRQPEGTTRSLTLSVPVGWSRFVRFSSNEYRGIVEVLSDNGIQTVDTSVDPSAEIGRSRTSLLIWNYVIVLAIYAAVFTALSGMLFLAVRYRIRYPQKMDRFWRKHRFHAALAVICAAALAIMVKLCGRESFWRDEFSLIQYITQTDSIIIAMLTDVAWPPVWKGIMFIWYRLVPYGDKWLMLMPELCYLPGIFFTGLCGEELFNQRVGILAAIAAASSPCLIIRAASDLTCYSFLFSLSAITLFFYIKWIRKEQRSWRDAIPMVAAMILASYTHYFGFFLSGALFLGELVKCIGKRIKPKALMPYVIVGILYSPWMYYILAIGNVLSADYWQPPPVLSDIPAFLTKLCGGIQNRYDLLLIGIIFLVVLFLETKRKRGSLDTSMYVLLWLPLILFTCVYLYGKYIAIGNTFWVWTYFIVTVPCVTVIIAASADWIYMLVADHQTGRNRIISLSLLIFAVLFNVVQSYRAVEQWPSMDPFRETVQWLYYQWDYMYDPNTIIVSANLSSVTQGMITYYVTQNGKIAKEDVRIADIEQIEDDEILSKERVIMLGTVDLRGEMKERVERLYKELSRSYTQTETMIDRKIYIFERKDTGA